MRGNQAMNSLFGKAINQESSDDQIHQERSDASGTPPTRSLFFNMNNLQSLKDTKKLHKVQNNCVFGQDSSLVEENQESIRDLFKLENQLSKRPPSRASDIFSTRNAEQASGYRVSDFFGNQKQSILKSNSFFGSSSPKYTKKTGRCYC